MRKAYVSLISVIMVVVMAFALCACNISPRIGADMTISEQEMFRLIVSVVSDEKNLSDAYSAIPEKQQGKVSYSYFKAYTDILRRLSRSNGSIESFKVLSSVNKQKVLDSYIEGTDLDSSFWDKYGDITIAELEFTRKDVDPVYMVITKNKSGEAQLSSDWVSDTINMYNYAEHYFDMLSDQNVDGVFTLIKPCYKDDGYSDSVIRAKAQALINYYLLSVKSLESMYDYKNLSPAKFDIRIPSAIDQFSDSIVEHNLSVRFDGIDSYVDDAIYEVFDTDVITLYKDNEKLLKYGNNYYNEGVNRLMGTTPGIDTLYKFEEYGGAIGQRVVGYVGLNLIVDLITYTDNSWYGKLLLMRVYGEEFTLGQYIRVGMTMDELMIHYPFIDENNFDIIVEDNGVTVQVNYELEDDVITLIKVEEVK